MAVTPHGPPNSYLKQVSQKKTNHWTSHVRLMLVKTRIRLLANVSWLSGRWRFSLAERSVVFSHRRMIATGRAMARERVYIGTPP
jgi:hypothetical protein